MVRKPKASVAEKSSSSCRFLRVLLFVLLALPVSVSRSRAEGETVSPGGTAVSPAHAALPSAVIPDWLERMRIGGTLEIDFAWNSEADAGDGSTGSASDLFLRKAELGVGLDMTDRISGFLLLAAENLGTEDETGLTVDEATVTLRKKGLPLSLVAGKRTQPFGRFENHLVADPMTQDAYETKRPGVTAEWAGPSGIGFSATLYGGGEMTEHLFESDLFDAGTIARRDDSAGNDVSSFILSASIRPLDGPVTLFGSFLSEPGKGNRNEAAGVGAHLEIDRLSGFRIDGEYMKAVDRERYAGFDRKFREGVLSLTAAYEFVMREREVFGGGLHAQRKAHVVAEPLEISLRFEHFDDDGMADASGSFSVRNRYGGGARYSLFTDPERGLSTYIACEFRRTDFRVHPGAAASRPACEKEAFARLGMTF